MERYTGNSGCDMLIYNFWISTSQSRDTGISSSF